MTHAPKLAVALLAFVWVWGSARDVLQAEIFGYRDERGILHFSNIRDNPRWVPLPVPPSARPRTFDANDQEYPFARIVAAQARAAGLDAALVRAIIKVESDFDPRARSDKGAMGLMQLLPQTAQRYGRFNLLEPADNIRVGVRHLKLLLAQFGNDLRLALAAYNAGAATVAQHGGIPPFPETIAYVGRVLGRYKSYRASNVTFSGSAWHGERAETR